jgi:predicted transcriptional regulator
MELVWKSGPMTVKRALFLLEPHSKPAYTTVMTVLSRLAEKGLLTREKDGRNFVYRPTLGRKEFLKSRVRTVTACLKKNFASYLK